MRRVMLALVLGCTSSLGCDKVLIETPATRAAEASLGLVAELEPDGSFTPLHVGVGSLAVSLDSIRAADNGALLYFSFGNPLMADLQNIRGTITWGTLDAAGARQFEDGNSRSGILAESVPAGRWSSVSFLVPGLTPSQIPVVRLSKAAIGRMELRR